MYVVAFPATLSVGVETANTIVEYLFILDFILNFFQCYKDEESMSVIKDRKMIALKYLQGWFLIDFVSIFPFNLILTNPN